MDRCFSVLQTTVVVNGVKSDRVSLCQVSYKILFLVTSWCPFHLNDIMSDIETETRIFADDCVKLSRGND